MQPDTTSDYYQLSFPKFRWHLYSSCHTVGAESFGHKVNNQHRTHKNRLIVRSLLAKQKKPAKQERRPFSFLLGKLSLQNIQTIIGGNFLCREENCRTLFLNPSLITYLRIKKQSSDSFVLHVTYPIIWRQQAESRYYRCCILCCFMVDQICLLYWKQRQCLCVCSAALVVTYCLQIVQDM